MLRVQLLLSSHSRGCLLSEMHHFWEVLQEILGSSGKLNGEKCGAGSVGCLKGEDICMSHVGRWWHCGSRKVVLRVIGHVGPMD